MFWIKVVAIWLIPVLVDAWYGFRCREEARKGGML